MAYMQKWAQIISVYSSMSFHTHPHLHNHHSDHEIKHDRYFSNCLQSPEEWSVKQSTRLFGRWKPALPFSGLQERHSFFTILSRVCHWPVGQGHNFL